MITPPLTDIAARNSALMRLSEPTRAALFEQGEVRSFAPGSILYHDGEAAGVVLFPLSGLLQMGKATAQGRRQIFCDAAGATCDGICLLMFHDYALAEARGVEGGQALVIERTAFQGQMRQDPVLCQLAWRSASNCMAHLSAMVTQLSFNKVAERVAWVLVEGTEADGDQVRVTQAQLAARIGTTREVVARCLGELQAAGWIRSGRGRIIVLDRDALRNTYQRS